MPLLQLPTELRSLIWTYAFGNRTVHPRRRSPISPFIYLVCQEPFSDQVAYNLSLRGASKHDTRLYAAEELYAHAWNPAGPHKRVIGLAGMHDYCYSHSMRAVCDVVLEGIGPSLVCRQVYYEAMPVAWRTTTFAFFSAVFFENWIEGMGPERRFFHLI
ncbi:hypothetical protein BU23DRAFT_158790 [Bimuria novae-zelandiae CBS 107.79]|uniref:DUF7730 domain-containing protein n=1 Tax=Bimuria novae-zelandiae CBS 107.79 TaxID=1447943 RepID=A0A6A5V6F0_9PLEO|nr:hypothetical protein BU23DRAFT_158790 [Bimuria novae-zelandiae CBS 107.79]